MNNVTSNNREIVLVSNRSLLNQDDYQFENQISLLAKIFFSLISSDLKSASCVCKNWTVLVRLVNHATIEFAMWQQEMYAQSTSSSDDELEF